MAAAAVAAQRIAPSRSGVASALDGHARNLFRQADRQFSSGESRRPAARPRNEAVRRRVCCLFLLVMTYTWQHFKAIEYGYKIESLKNAARRACRSESRAAAGRSVAALSGSHRCNGASIGNAIAASRPDDPHGLRLLRMQTRR